MTKLKPLSRWQSSWCRVDARLTQPALARYQQMFPKEQDLGASETWGFTWKARETSCEVVALDKSVAMDTQKSFLETALCTLLQTHWVNSPFDELEVTPDQITRSKDGQVQIVSAAGPEFGMFLDPNHVQVETRTRKLGTFIARYSNQNGEWLPERLEQTSSGTRVVIDRITYADKKIGTRRVLDSLWISLGGAEQAFDHTQLTFSNCQAY